MMNEYLVIGGPYDGMKVPHDDEATRLTAAEHIDATMLAVGVEPDAFKFDGETIVWSKDGR